MEHEANKNGAAKPMAGTVAADVVQVEPGSQVVVVRAGEEEVPSADQIRAQTDQLATVLASPLAQKAVEGVLQLLSAKSTAEAARASAEVEKAKIHAEQQREATKDYNERAFKFATSFLWALTATGVCALVLVGIFAFTGALKDTSLSAFAMFVVGSIFGGTIYGTTLRKQDKP